MKKQFLLASAVVMLTLLITQKVHSQRTKTLDKATTNAVINSLIKQLNDTYIFPEVAKTAEIKIREYQKKGAYSKISDPKELAETLKNQLREIVKDKHLGVWYNPDMPSGPQDEAAEKAREEQFMRRMGRVNLGFPKLDILEGNVGYLKIDGFGPVDKVGETVTGAMMYLANTEALIIDLRENHGGEPELVQYVASYFFGDAPVHINDLYYRKGNETTEYWTIPVKGKKYINKPVYVLTSSQTFSGGEELAYDLQTQNRATLVGETTGGGANPGGTVDLGNGFYAFIPDGRAINPITKTNWEGTGVKPEVAVPAADALKKAHVMALEKLLETALDEESKSYYQSNMETVAKK
ncbi:hypothetical protein HYN59_10765 [Flavobacterium album]|uniref:Tail specific protease domain-containing protein n=1 Tax=Flavobacterium album TaxID=2175091 RepID=A0A2S1QYW1_9FLAO|nr:S41 family peptidase [Flavobacterium album]AWH85562.1 hypothetical protein HYN59_10765 [Flavobacterium album]